MLKTKFANFRTLPFLTRIDVLADENCYAIVIAGDSTMTNEKPYYLAERLHKMGIHNVAVLQQALNGNRILDDGKGVIANLYGESLLNRYDKDILSCPGVKKIILKEGVNDILHPRALLTRAYTDMTTAEDIIDGLQKVIDRSHENGFKIYVSKFTPFKGFGKLIFNINDFEWTQESQDVCDDVNSWMDNCNADGVINADFIYDENKPYTMKAEYSIDFIHYKPIAQKLFVENIDEDILR